MASKRSGLCLCDAVGHSLLHSLDREAQGGRGDGIHAGVALAVHHGSGHAAAQVVLHQVIVAGRGDLAVGDGVLAEGHGDGHGAVAGVLGSGVGAGIVLAVGGALLRAVLTAADAVVQIVLDVLGSQVTGHESAAAAVACGGGVVLHTVALAAAVADSVQAGDGSLGTGQDAVLTIGALIKSGISVCIFPEGTRNRNESDLELLEFHEGSFRLATKTDCLIVPIAMNNTVSIFEKQFPKIRKNHVVLEYCKPFRPSELSKEDQKHIGEYTRTLILETLKKN